MSLVLLSGTSDNFNDLEFVLLRNYICVSILLFVIQTLDRDLLTSPWIVIASTQVMPGDSLDYVAETRMGGFVLSLSIYLLTTRMLWNQIVHL